MRALVLNNDNNNSNANGNNNLNNNACFVSNNLSTAKAILTMEKDLYSQLCSYENLELAWKKARKHKTLKPYVIEFEKNLKNNLLLLQTELLLHSYRPKPLKTFILRDPKSRVISKSDFRDRIVHHAICNIIELIFEKTFIYDSYANRKGKGVLKALKRFDQFKRKVSRNNTLPCFILKADIKHYFNTVDHKTLISIIKRKIKDENLILLIKIILENHKTKEESKGMPLGNLTSQFFANVYLNELDHFVKHSLKAEYYIRYVDDFIIMHSSREKLEEYQIRINDFLRNSMELQLHPEKSKIFPLCRGTSFLGLRIFPYHKLLIKRNLRKFKRKLSLLCLRYGQGVVEYDDIYDFLEGWLAYSRNADTYKLRCCLLKEIEPEFRGETSTKEYNQHLKLKHN